MDVGALRLIGGERPGAQEKWRSIGIIRSEYARI
jgi:hypothetical protein